MAFVFGEDHTFDVFGEIDLYCDKYVRADNVTLCNPLFEEDLVGEVSFHENESASATEEFTGPIKDVFAKAEKLSNVLDIMM